ncbi:hypothetical protein INT47_011648 [Mucor saturninus]|uniref:Uncharacterized protein n=1 Tax=Mucor saturninus TaxID=64648 RepID=A0A8H7R5T5_9FUNG|nr:hypothetical protein INT47_011648 [Mucor saturninus]
MSKSTTKNSTVLVPTIWKRFPHRIKGLLKRDIFYSNSPPPPPPQQPQQVMKKNYSKSSSLMYRIFPTKSSKKKKDSKFIQHNQWVNNHDCHVELDICHEVPLRANLMSLFHSQDDWSLPERFDGVSRVYIGTLGKIRLLSLYSMEQQIAIHHLLSGIQSNSSRKKLLTLRAGHEGSFQRDFHTLLSGKVHESSLLNRKPRRTRYIFMLLSTPTSHIVDKLHPVSDAIAKLRRPYAETICVFNSSELASPSPPSPPPPPAVCVEEETYKCVSPDYLLDPASLRGGRLSPNYSSTANRENDHYNQDASSIAPFMAKIQIQTN